MILVWAGLALLAATLGYAVFALVSTLIFRRRPRPAQARTALTVLKPLHGDQPLLYDNLRKLLQESDPENQFVFGIAAPDDPAMSVIARLKHDVPARDFAVTTTAYPHGLNPKIRNLRAMMTAARHDILVFADSDIAAPPGYLRAVAADLSAPDVGAVTCAYLGRPARDTLLDRLGALQINDNFLPSVLVARALGQTGFCLGATIALRRGDLVAIGGLEALADMLADDYEIGRRLSALGRKIVLSPILVETTVDEPSLAELWDHELRWARTVRSLRPFGFAFSFLALPLSSSLIAGAILWGSAAPALAGSACLAGLAARLGLSLTNALLFRRPFHPLLAVARDLLSFAVWSWSWTGRTVVWQGQRLTVARGGRLAD